VEPDQRALTRLDRAALLHDRKSAFRLLALLAEGERRKEPLHGKGSETAAQVAGFGMHAPVGKISRLGLLGGFDGYPSGSVGGN
jgi:hypothetical protein